MCVPLYIQYEIGAWGLVCDYAFDWQYVMTRKNCSRQVCMCAAISFFVPRAEGVPRTTAVAPFVYGSVNLAESARRTVDERCTVLRYVLVFLE